MIHYIPWIIEQEIPDIRVEKVDGINIATDMLGNEIARVIDGSHPIFPTSWVGLSLSKIVMQLIEENQIEWTFLDHASGNWILGIVAACCDLLKDQKITFTIFNDICKKALDYSQFQARANNLDSSQLLFALWDDLESILQENWINEINFSVSNMYQHPGDDGSELQIQQTMKIYELLGPQWKMLVKWVSYAPEIMTHFQSLFQVQQVWTGECTNRFQDGIKAQVVYVLGERWNRWV